MKIFFIVESPQTDVGKAEVNTARYALRSFAKDWLVKVPLEQIKETDIGPQDIIWWHWPAEDLPNQTKDPALVRKLLGSVENGARLFLTLGAVQLPAAMGIDGAAPDLVEAGRWRGESGAYASRGLMAFARHPLFNQPHNLRTNVFTWTPQTGEPYWLFAFTKSQPPQVIARGCGYISFLVDRASAWEIRLGRGRILCIGSYFYFNARRNYNRNQLEAFLQNCVHYLSAPPGKDKPDQYWPEPQTGCREAPDEAFIHLPEIRLSYPPEKQFSRPGVAGLQNFPGHNYYCCASRRVLLSGIEGERLSEVWSYPFRVLRDLRWSLHPGGKAGIEQESLFKTALHFPDAAHQRYEGELFGVLEQIGTSIFKPAAFQQLEIVSEVDFHLELFFASDMALMWPMPDGAVGMIHYRYDPIRNAVLLLSGAKRCWGLVGLSVVPEKVDFADLSTPEASLLKCSIRLPMMKAGVNYLSITALGGRLARGFEPEISTATYMDIDRSADHYRKLQENMLRIKSPAEDLDQAMEWAQLKLEGFLAVTPAVGRSLTAGYANSGEGWLKNRPGYGWYFGRDSLWTGLGLLTVGRWNAVSDTLRFLAGFQRIDGKIIHEVSPSDYAHFDSADANPLFIMLAERYLRWTGDDQTIRDLLPALRSALEFSFEMDRDRDGLTENTGVGHGWIEGGELFEAHVTVYLAGIWLRALKSALVIFALDDDQELLERLREAERTVRETISTRFWNKKDETYYYSQLMDGSMNPADTIMPAPIIIFGDLDAQQDLKFLRRVSGPDIVTDWGARMISELDKRYNPVGYHSGSVWPLYTGWLGLAQYARGRSLQGYELLRAGAANFNHFSVGGFSEVLRGDVYKEAGVCPDQAWSAALLLALFAKGLLGLFPDVDGRLFIRTDIPPDWHDFSVENIRWADGRIDLEYKRNGLDVFFRVKGIKAGDRITLAPYFPRGTRIADIRLNGEAVSTSIASSLGRFSPQAVLDGSEGEVELHCRLERYLSPMPALRMPKVGAPSKGYRIVDWDHGVDHIWVELMGAGGSEDTLTIIDPGDTLAEDDMISKAEGEKKTVTFRFPSSKELYSSITLRFLTRKAAD
jgi:glycogen debranching enzyme